MNKATYKKLFGQARLMGSYSLDDKSRTFFEELLTDRAIIVSLPIEYKIQRRIAAIEHARVCEKPYLAKQRHAELVKEAGAMWFL